MTNYQLTGTVKDGAATVGDFSGTLNMTIAPPPVDTTKPVINSVVVTPASGAASSKRTIKVNATDAGGGLLTYTCWVGGQQATASETPGEFTASPQDTAAIDGNVTDEAGNRTAYTGSVVVAVGPPIQTGTIPLRWDDPRFNSTILQSTVTLPIGANLSNKSYNEYSGGSTVVCAGNNIVSIVRVKSREGVRVGGPGNFEYSECYIEANGSGSDHADGLQAYAPGARGVIKAKNSSFVMGMTAVNCGFFIADNWTGTIDLENVMFTGGCYGLRAHPDYGGDNIIRLKNVFFVPPFLYGPFYFSNVAGHKNIFDLWENVCYATISNGQLIPGAAIPKPA